MLLIALAILGVIGSRYIDMGAASSAQVVASETALHNNTMDAEIELIFSSPPLSYTLKKPSVTGDDEQTVFQSSAPIENPCYGEVNLVAHSVHTYWLDVVWPEDAAENTRHFVQISISPNHGEGQKFSFFNSAREMNETFEYGTGEEHHE